MMKLGAETVFVGSGIFKAGASLEGAERLKAQQRRANAIVESVLFYKDAKKLAEISKGLGEAMVGINCSELPAFQRMADRGW
jgi:pyridoxal 5'-phosphate synthase pdxS subunit